MFCDRGRKRSGVSRRLFRPRERGRVEPLEAARRRHRILVVEDDPDLRELLELLLSARAIRSTAVTDGAAALDLVAQGALRPDLMLADNNLPGGMNGLQVAALLREWMPGLPVRDPYRRHSATRCATSPGRGART